MNPTSLDTLFRQRRSIRRFLPEPVPQTLVREILELAACAPSGTNIQPWKVYALAGSAKDSLAEALGKALLEKRQETLDFPYYPKEWLEPWRSRRRKVGFDLYGLLGLTKDNKLGMQKQAARNFCFFDAPVALLLTLDSALADGMLLDYGLFMGHLLIAAESRGLATCAQAAIAEYPQTLRESLQLPPTERIVCGIALGYADKNAPENQLRTERESVDVFTEFRGF